MPLAAEDEQAIDEALQVWRQGDVCLDPGLEFLHLADLSRPHSPASEQAAEGLSAAEAATSPGPTPVADGVSGMVMLSQTCDVIRNCRERPFVEVAPLVEMPGVVVEEIRLLRRPGFAYVPATAKEGLVADLDRTMTVEKALVARWGHVRGWTTDDELRAFVHALARKRSRFAFPDDFVVATRGLQRHLQEKHNRQTPEGAHLRAVREIRVRAAPSWDASDVHLNWWFIKEGEPADTPADWQTFLAAWIARFNNPGRFQLDHPIACRLEDMTALDYIESDPLDLDYLSVSRRAQ